jgi:hypothetical protein
MKLMKTDTQPQRMRIFWNSARIIAAIMLVGALTSVGRADFNGGDTLGSGSSNWTVVPQFASGNGQLLFQNNCAEFIVGNPAVGDNIDAHRWNINTGSYVKDWSVEVGIHLALVSLPVPPQTSGSSDSHVNLNLVVVSAKNTNNAFSVAMDRYQTYTEYGSDFECGFNSGLLFDIPSTATDGIVKISFNSTQKTLTASYNTGTGWNEIQTVSITSGSNNWGMGANDVFYAILASSSGNDWGATSAAISSGDAYYTNFLAATPTPTQMITFPSLPGKGYGDADFAPGATASSGLAVNYSSSNPSVATIGGGKIHITGIGKTTITAQQPGTGKMSPAPDVAQELSVAKGTPAITWANPAAIAYGKPLSATQLNAKANVPGQFVYSPAAGITMLAGTQTLGATFTPADAAHYNSVQKSVPLTVNKAAAKITIEDLKQVYDGQPKPVTVTTAPAGLNVSIDYNGSADAPVDAGSYPVTAAVVDDNAGGSKTASLIIARATQTTNFPALPTMRADDADYVLSATTSSSLSVSYLSSNPAVATIVNGEIHLIGKGSTVITAIQAGNANWNAAKAVKQKLNVIGTQAITFPVLPAKGYGDPDFEPGATASSGLAVNYSSSNLSVATIVSGKIHITGSGASTITARQPGASGWSPAPDATQELSVGKGTPVITWTNPAAIAYGKPLSATQLNAKANVPGQFVYSPAAGTTLSAGAQPLNVTFTPTDTTRYNTTQKSVPFTVNKAAATVSITGLSQAYNGQPRPITVATVPAGLNVHVTYNGSTDIPVNAGSYTVTATVDDPNATGTKIGKLVITNAVPEVPASPTGVTATAGNGKITIRWNLVPNATSYNIYWSTTPGVTKKSANRVNNHIINTYTHTGRTNGTPYYYIVTAANFSGESGASVQVSGTPSSTADLTEITADISRICRDDGYTEIEYYVDITNNGIEVGNATVSVNGINIPNIGGFAPFYDLREYDNPSASYVPGQDYTVSVQYNGNTYTDTIKAPGGFSSNTDYTQVQWLYNGKYGTLDVAHLYGSTTYTIPSARPLALLSPRTIPSSAYPTTDTYTVTLWQQNIKENTFGSLSGAKCHINITDAIVWKISK